MVFQSLEDGVSEKLLSDLVQFISDTSTSQETIPTATLLTGKTYKCLKLLLYLWIHEYVKFVLLIKPML